MSSTPPAVGSSTSSLASTALEKPLPSAVGYATADGSVPLVIASAVWVCDGTSPPAAATKPSWLGFTLTMDPASMPLRSMLVEPEPLISA